MLLLGNHTLPTTRDELTASLDHGLLAAFHFPGQRSIITAEGEFPALAHLAFNLTSASMKLNYRPAKPQGARQKALFVRDFHILGKPIYYEKTPVTFEIQAEDVQFDFTHDALGRSLLDPSAARQGKLHATIAQADLHTLFIAALREAAEEHGANIEQGEIKLTSQDERSAQVHVRVVVSKKVFLTRVQATILAKGRVDVDQTLNAMFSKLECSGEGMIGNLVVGLIRQELKKWEGKSIPLNGFGLSSLQLRDLRIRCDNGLQVEAVFGS